MCVCEREREREINRECEREEKKGKRRLVKIGIEKQLKNRKVRKLKMDRRRKKGKR